MAQHSGRLSGKRVAVLVETEYIYDEIEAYRTRIPALGGEVHFLSILWGQPERRLINDIDSPDRAVRDLHELRVTECVTQCRAEDFDIVICAANYVAVRLREIPPMGSVASASEVGLAPAVQFFAEAMANPSITKAAMCHALWILTPNPQLLRGRRVMCHTVVLSDVLNAGGAYVTNHGHVVVDGDLVTARSFADFEEFFATLVDTACQPRNPPEPQETIQKTAREVADSVEVRFNEAKANLTHCRPVAVAAAGLLDGSLDVPAEVRRLTGTEVVLPEPNAQRSVLLVSSIYGTWASELTLPVGVLMKAGYRVVIATEDGSPPHLLSPSLDPTFTDGAWRLPVVSSEERDLALRFLKPGTDENGLFGEGRIFDLKGLAKPPQVGDYLKDKASLRHYRHALVESMNHALSYDALVIAGGSGAVPGLMFDRGLHALILAFYRLNKPIMGQCNGGLALVQTLDPHSGAPLVFGRAVTTHSSTDEYQAGWGWTKRAQRPAESFWRGDGTFDLEAYGKSEEWITPGVTGNPLVESETYFRSGAGPAAPFFSPVGSAYAVAVDGPLITCRTTPDGYAGVLCLLASLVGRPPLTGRLFIDADRRGRRDP